MLIFVKINQELTTAYIVSPSDTIGSIKELIYKETSIHPHYQRLTYHDHSEDLEDDKTLSDYNIQNNSTLHLFDDLSTLLEFLQIIIPTITNVTELLIATSALIFVAKTGKKEAAFYDSATLSKISELLRLYYQVYELNKFQLPLFALVKISELNKSVSELNDEMFKLIEAKKQMLQMLQQLQHEKQ